MFIFTVWAAEFVVVSTIVLLFGDVAGAGILIGAFFRDSLIALLMDLF